MMRPCAHIAIKHVTVQPSLRHGTRQFLLSWPANKRRTDKVKHVRAFARADNASVLPLSNADLRECTHHQLLPP